MSTLGPSASIFPYLAEKQHELENRSIERGRIRYQERLQKNQKAQTETQVRGPAKTLLNSERTRHMETGVRDLLATKAKAGPVPEWFRIFKELGPEFVVGLTAKAVLDSLTSRVSASKVCLKISSLFLDELRQRKFQKAHPGLFNWKFKNFNTSSYPHMKRSLDAALLFSKVDVEEYSLDTGMRALVGAKALDLFVAATGFVEIHKQSGTKKASKVVVATDETLNQAADMNARYAASEPIFMPMLIPPRPWGERREDGTLIPGGYWFNSTLVKRCQLIRTWSQRERVYDLDSLDITPVYTALNALQETSYHINRPVLDVMETFKNMGVAIAGLPAHENTPLPPKPYDIDTNPVSRKEWRRQAHIIHDENHERKCEALRFSKVLTAAHILLEETDPDGRPLAFYFPYNLDFRGRAYPIPVYLQPQGDDICRGLLTFGEGRALRSNQAVDWLAIHGANLLGKTPQGEDLEKRSFEERIQWIENHTEQILAAADDPVSNTELWSVAENPWQFLGFCFEWAGFIRSGRSLDFVSCLPVSMDGSCNGLQHYAALMRDPELAIAVNLVPSDIPQDIYKTVAASVVEILERDAAAGSTLAMDWLKWGKINRKFVKRPVMTLPYGSKLFGFREQTKEFLKKLDAKDRPEFFKSNSDGFDHCIYIAKVVWDALAQTSEAAMRAMKFFQECARIAAKDNTPIIWFTPTGLPIVESYPETRSTQPIRAILAGSLFRPRFEEEVKGQLDRGKQVSGIAPNIVHSLDASAMMLTVVEALKENVSHFLMVHDSFGTHAADAPRLSQLTREVFVRMYGETDVLGDLVANLTATIDPLRDEVPAVPEQGTLDLSEVLASPYFFA
jgi:DNA-directed RNA polymerase